MWRVSIPHRYAENQAMLLRGEDQAMVSIPHRYAENFDIYGSAGTGLNGFQSLIGMLKTKINITANKIGLTSFNPS